MQHLHVSYIFTGYVELKSVDVSGVYINDARSTQYCRTTQQTFLQTLCMQKSRNETNGLDGEERFDIYMSLETNYEFVAYFECGLQRIKYRLKWTAIMNRKQVCSRPFLTENVNDSGCEKICNNLELYILSLIYKSQGIPNPR